MKAIAMTRPVAWRGLAALPAKRLSGWSVSDGRNEVASDHAAAERIAARWVPATRQLLGPPDAKQMLPAIFVPSLEERALRSARRASRTILLAQVFLFAAFAVAALATWSWRLAAIAAVALLTVCAFVHDYAVCHKSSEQLKERALFLYALRDPRQNRLRVGFWFVLALLMAATQLLVMWRGGGLVYAFEAYGFLYGEVESGSWWRVLTGPYLHYSVQHFAVNLCMLVMAGPLASLLVGRWSLLSFAAAASLTGLAQWALGPHVLTSFGGISGGVYALLGLVIGLHVMGKRRMPKGFAMIIGSLTAGAIISVELLSDTAASIAHVSGVMLGLVAAVLSSFKITGPVNRVLG